MTLFWIMSAPRWVERVGSSRPLLDSSQPLIGMAEPCWNSGNQDVRGGDRILDGEIDPDAADRRHRVRGVANAESPGRYHSRKRFT